MTVLSEICSATINSTNPVWVGAWWIPFLGFGGLILLFTWGPITGYPERLPKSKAKYIEQSSQQDLAVKKGNLLKALKPVLKSSTVWLIALNSAAQCKNFIQVELYFYAINSNHYSIRIPSYFSRININLFS